MMKIKSQLAVVGLLLSGLLAVGCQQQQTTGGQQIVETPAPAPAPAPAPVVKPAPPPPPPVVPQVKAKGNYKGPVNINRGGVMQQYQR